MLLFSVLKNVRGPICQLCVASVYAVVLYAISAVYFAGVMVRLMLTLTPVVCILSGVAFSRLLELYLKEEDENPAAIADASDTEEEAGGEKNSRNLYDKVCRTSG